MSADRRHVSHQLHAARLADLPEHLVEVPPETDRQRSDYPAECGDLHTSRGILEVEPLPPAAMHLRPFAGQILDPHDESGNVPGAGPERARDLLIMKDGKGQGPQGARAMYRDVLAIDIAPWGGAIFRYNAPGHPPLESWMALRTGSREIASSTHEFMINFAVDDLAAFIARLKGKGVAILKVDTADPNGAFAWILDPDGTKIELWQPKGP